MKSSRPCLVTWLLVSITAFAHPSSRERIFVVRSDTMYGAETNATGVKAVSMMDCARKCELVKLCRRFSYNDDQRTCYMSRDMLDSGVTAGSTFGRYCPRGFGYEEIFMDSKRRCINTGHERMNYTAGRNRCMSERAHLFTLESLNNAIELSTKVGNAAFVCIDGGTERKTWYDEELPWTNWGGDPQDGLCTILFTLMKNTMTYACDEDCQPACEIDV